MSRIASVASHRNDLIGFRLNSLDRFTAVFTRAAIACLAIVFVFTFSGCGGSSVPVANAPRNPPAGLAPAGGIDAAPAADAGMPGDAGAEMPGDGAASGEAGGEGEAGAASAPKVPGRPKDFADWKDDDYRNAAKAGDRRLAKAAEHYASVTTDKTQVVKLFEELLAVKPDANAGTDDGSATPDGSQDASATSGEAGAMPGDDASVTVDDGTGGQINAAARTMLLWLVANPSSDSRRVLERVLKADLQTLISHATAARLILRGVLENRSDETANVFWIALTEPHKYVPAKPAAASNESNAGDAAPVDASMIDGSGAEPLTRDSLQRLAMQLLNSKPAPELRMKLAEHVTKETTAKDQKNLLGGMLLQPRVENLRAQLLLYESPKTSTAAKTRFERYFKTYSSEGLHRLMRIPPDGPPGDGNQPLDDPNAGSAEGGGLPGDGSMPGDGGLDVGGLDANDPGAADAPPRLTAWDNDEQQMYRDLSHLWDQVFVETVDKRLVGLTSFSQDLELLRLAVSLPATPVRVTLHKLLQKQWQTGPTALKEAGMFARDVHDPGLMLVVKAVPREQDKRTRQAKEAAAARLTAASKKSTEELETKAAWLGANYELLRTLNRRFYAAATAIDRPPPPRREGGQPDNPPPRRSDDLFSMAGAPSPNWGWLTMPLTSMLAADPPAHGDPSVMPLKLLPDANIVAEHHINWPAELEDKLDGAKVEPLAVHYVRIEQEGRLTTIAGTFSRQLSPAATYTPSSGIWLDAQDKGSLPGHRRSIDVLILPESAHQTDGQAGDGSTSNEAAAPAPDPASNPRAAAQAQNASKKYVIEILTIEVPDPTQ